MKQPTMNQVSMNLTNTLTPYNKVLPQLIRDELTMPIIHSHFCIFALYFCFLLFLFVSLIIFQFFCKLYKIIKFKDTVLQYVNSQSYTIMQPKQEKKLSSQYTNIPKLPQLLAKLSLGDL